MAGEGWTGAVSRLTIHCEDVVVVINGLVLSKTCDQPAQSRILVERGRLVIDCVTTKKACLVIKVDYCNGQVMLTFGEEQPHSHWRRSPHLKLHPFPTAHSIIGQSCLIIFVKFLATWNA